MARDLQNPSERQIGDRREDPILERAGEFPEKARKLPIKPANDR